MDTEGPHWEIAVLDFNGRPETLLVIANRGIVLSTTDLDTCEIPLDQVDTLREALREAKAFCERQTRREGRHALIEDEVSGSDQ